MKYLLSKLVGDEYIPQIIVSSMTEAKEIRKIINPQEDDYRIDEVQELG